MYYQERLASLASEARDILARRNRRRIFLAACAALFVMAGLSTHPALPFWAVAVPALALAASLPAYLGLQQQLEKIGRLQVFHEANLRRVDGTMTQSGHAGEEFHTKVHLYDYDLNVLGSDSLFGLLATVRTGLGQSGLARLLLEPATREEVLARQQCVQELAPLDHLREQIALLGPSRFHDTAARSFEDWLEESNPAFHPAISWALAAASFCIATLSLCALLHRIAWLTALPMLALCFTVQTAIFLRIRVRVLSVLRRRNLLTQVQLFADGVELLLKQRFTSPHLHQLQNRLREPASAAPALRKLQHHFSLAEQMNKEYAVLLSIFTCFGSHAAISISRWRSRYADALRQWSASWGEFEALVALANYAFEHPENNYPELIASTEAAQLHAVALAHPLLPAESCVRNDVTLDSRTRFYLISGSNMAGKSTLLRTIGLNTVLAYAGAPVPAQSMRLSLLSIGAAISVTDSLADGKSKFLAEVERLSKILALGHSSSTLFLIDEIFSGTNSQDRAVAAEAVLRDLLHNGAIGALSTHDLTLTTLASEQNGGVNVHMASPNSEDPLAFDFLLKPGINRTTNALAIVRMMGIETERKS